MQTITLAFDPRSRALTADFGGAGTVIDDAAVTFHLDPIEGATVDLVYGVTIYDGGRRYHPISRFDKDGDVHLKHQVLDACTGGQLPISLRIVYDSRVVVGSRQLILKVDVVPDAYEDHAAAFGEALMMRTSGWEWVPEWRYDRHSMVWWKGRMFVSLRDDNMGHAPDEDDPDDAVWWQQQGLDGVSPIVWWEDDVLVIRDVCGEHRSPPLTGPPGPQGLPAESTTPGEFVKRYIGDGKTTEFDVIHNLHEETVFWQALDISGDVPEYVDVRATVVDDCHIHLSFTRPPAINSVVVIISSGMGFSPPPECAVPGELVIRYIGNNSDRVCDVEHNLNTIHPIVQLQDMTAEYPEHIDARWCAVDPNHIRVFFTNPPDYNAVCAVISSGLGTGVDVGTAESGTYTPYVHSVTDAAATWRIQHNLGRPTSFTTIDTSGRVVLGAEVIESDNVTVEYFGAPLSGRAIER